MKDLTGGSPIKLIIYFTLPIIAGNLLQLLYTLVDTYIVGQTLGVSALAAIGSGVTLFHLLFGLSNNIAIGFALVTSQAYGAKDMESVKKSFATGIVLVLLISLVLMAIFIPTAGLILKAMRTPQEILSQARDYLTILLYGIAAFMMFNLFAGVLRGVGDSKTPVYFLALTNLLNIILDYFFILVLKTDVSGVALATVISQVTSCICCIVYISKKYPDIMPTIQHLKAFRSQLKQHLKLGMPMGFQQSVIEIGNMIVQFMINGLGVTAIAAVVAAQRIRAVAMMPMFSLGNAMHFYTAQNFGAGLITRIKDGVKSSLTVITTFGLLVTVVLVIFSKNIVSIFVNDATVIAMATDYLTVQGSMIIMLGVLLVLRSTLQGMGIVSAPTYAGITEFITSATTAVVLVPVVGFWGITLTNPLAWILASVPLIITYVRTIKNNTDLPA